MLISDFDYELPEERIAKLPPAVRGSTRLLVCDVATNKIADSLYPDLDTWLEAGDLVILNNTKVIPARLKAINNNGKTIELLLTESHALPSTNTWPVIYKGKIRAGEILELNNVTLKILEIKEGGLAIVEFPFDVFEFAHQFGEVPIPPYLNREENVDDKTRYNTVFASTLGSVAAPTASLNMTNELLAKLQAKGVRVEYITLHVGLGTFMPVRTDEVTKHVMHSEYFEVTRKIWETIQLTQKSAGRICAVGTTVTRTLEYLASRDVSSDDDSDTITGEANIYIYPGYIFKIVDTILTNFHAPRSTPLLLVAAAMGKENLQRAYQHALAQQYNFLSYGDSMLIKLR